MVRTRRDWGEGGKRTTAEVLLFFELPGTVSVKQKFLIGGYLSICHQNHLSPSGIIIVAAQDQQ